MDLTYILLKIHDCRENKLTKCCVTALLAGSVHLLAHLERWHTYTLTHREAEDTFNACVNVASVILS